MNIPASILVEGTRFTLHGQEYICTRNDGEFIEAESSKEGECGILLTLSDTVEIGDNVKTVYRYFFKQTRRNYFQLVREEIGRPF